MVTVSPRFYPPGGRPRARSVFCSDGGPRPARPSFGGTGGGGRSSPPRAPSPGACSRPAQGPQPAAERVSPTFRCVNPESHLLETDQGLESLGYETLAPSVTNLCSSGGPGATARAGDAAPSARRTCAQEPRGRGAENHPPVGVSPWGRGPLHVPAGPQGEDACPGAGGAGGTGRGRSAGRGLGLRRAGALLRVQLRRRCPPGSPESRPSAPESLGRCGARGDSGARRGTGAPALGRWRRRRREHPSAFRGRARSPSPFPRARTGALSRASGCRSPRGGRSPFPYSAPGGGSGDGG